MSELLSLWAEWFPELWKGFVLSLQVTAISLVLGIGLGLLLALGVSAKGRALRYPALVIVELGRGAPALILLQYFYFGLPSANLTLSAFWARHWRWPTAPRRTPAKSFGAAWRRLPVASTKPPR
ncbi:hypothetical protein GLGCALEP_03043 [Pseudomonas sp. MM221]|nr:hypothetical protein GLGCALEP_03043 [Pseudomonas sp. MM221]